MEIKSIRIKIALILVALIGVFWWIGVWGLFETIVNPLIKNNYWKSIVCYSSIVLTIIIILGFSPKLQKETDI